MASRNRTRDAAADARLGPRELIELGPTIARLGALASLRVAGWASSSTAAAWKRIALAIRDGDSPTELLAEAGEQVRDAARSALGVTDLEATLERLVAGGGSLRSRGEELLDRSARVDADNGRHPAFGLILEQLAPDEMRILRALWTGGGQAALDVEATGPLGIGSRAVARRLSMLAHRAGCRHPERLQLYLDNLMRLGLVEVTDEPFEDEEVYEVLEVQPEVADAKEEASSGATRAKSVRQRIELTDFGRSFCETSLPPENRRGGR